MSIISSDEIIEWPTESFVSTVYTASKKYGNKTFMEDLKTNKTYSFNDLHQMLCQVAHAMTDLGVGKDHIVVFFGQNSFQTFSFLFGVILTGAAISPINPELKADELTKMFKVIRPSVIYCEQEKYLTGVNEAIKLSGIKTKVMTAAYFQSILPTYEDCREFQPAVIPDSKKHTYLVLFTSGTTGMPKAVKISDESTILQCGLLLWASGRLLLTSPVFWISNQLLVAKCIASGFTLIIPDLIVPERILQIIQNYKVTSWFSGPSLILEICNLDNVKNYDISSLDVLYVGGSTVPIEHRNFIRNTLNGGKNILRLVYGSTESGVICQWVEPIDPDRTEYASIGKLLPGIRLKVIDVNTMKILNRGEEGEFCVQTSAFMNGYMNKDLAGNELDEDGWWHMGDIGYYDDKGYIYFVSRLKDILKYRGVQIAPSELEEILLKHPSIIEACVAGKPHIIDGDWPVAFVVRKPNTNVTEKELEEFVSERVPDSKRIRAGIHFVDQFPTSAVGKVLTANLLKLLK